MNIHEYQAKDLMREYGIPVAKGLPIGHGPDHWPLPLNTPYRLDRHGRLEMLEWEWFGCRT